MIGPLSKPAGHSGHGNQGEEQGDGRQAAVEDAEEI